MATGRILRAATTALLVSLTILTGGGSGQAQEQAPVRLTLEQEKEALEISKLLRCPVCTGQLVAESNSEKALEIREEIRRMVAEGKTRQEILDYYADRYGDWILASPPLRGAGLVTWLWPVLVFGVGAALIAVYVKRVRGRPGAAVAGARPGGAETGAAGEEEYLRRLRDYL